MNPTLAMCFVVALLLTLWQLHDFLNFGGVCLQCGGKQKHRDDCPLKEDD